MSDGASRSDDAPVVAVALFTPLRRTFDYLLPDGMAPQSVTPGQRVLVPFGRARRIGVVIGLVATSTVDRSLLKPLDEVLEAAPALGADSIELAQWAAAYYHHPLGDVIAAMLPTWLRRRRDLPRSIEPAAWRLTARGEHESQRVRAAAVRRQFVLERLRQGACTAASFADAGFSWRPIIAQLLKKGWIETLTPAAEAGSEISASPVVLNAEQQRAVELIARHRSGFRVLVVEGVTGSGKTEVYLDAIAGCLRERRQALVLVPEIALTEQLVMRFKQRFGSRVGVLHSGLGEGERAATWVRCGDGGVRILIGTRSAVWVPLPELGLIVVDEEHDPSYKQQDGFHYSARDVGIVRAQRADIPIVLGSATPALETLANVNRGKYLRTLVSARAGAAPAPVVRCIDVRGVPLTAGLSDALIEAMRLHLARGEQVMLFLNRRGYSPLLMCHSCGEPRRCDRCDAYLVYHKGSDSARCHHCDRQWPAQRATGCCENENIRLIGHGTERIEETVRDLFPAARVCRIDRDTVRRKHALGDMLAAINAREIDIVIGTQMVAKGLDFSELTLVGVVDADCRLYSVDFRAEERLAQLLIQVAGRAGRAAKPGLVLVQTHHPEHPVLRRIIDHGYAAYAETALQERQAAALPPYAAMAIVRADSTTADVALEDLARVRKMLAGAATADLDLSYPIPALMERRAGRYRALVVIRASQRFDIGELLRSQISRIDELARQARVRWSIDVDPQDTL